jgi:hypothetical protein
MVNLAIGYLTKVIISTFEEKRNGSGKRAGDIQTKA